MEQIKQFVKKELAHTESGHGYWHAIRVLNNTRLIAMKESCNHTVAEAAALLHDVCDIKLTGTSLETQQDKIREFLGELQYASADIAHIEQIIAHMSFRDGFDKKTFSSKELDVVQDADRLDAIGAIGIARAFSYGGHKNREMHDPDVPPAAFSSKEEYTSAASPTINHFYEKLLKLKSLMNTDTAKQIAESRHRFMEEYLVQFLAEWQGDR